MLLICAPTLCRLSNISNLLPRCLHTHLWTPMTCCRLPVLAVPPRLAPYKAVSNWFLKRVSFIIWRWFAQFLQVIMMRSLAPFFPLCQPILLLVLVRYSASSTCYLPDGTTVNDIPCQGTEYSACCGKKDVCLSNGLCFGTNLQIGRGSCTDITWKASECPHYCIEGMLSFSLFLCSRHFIDI